MNTRAWKWIGASGLWTLGLAVLAGACGGTTANTPSLGSESHFLAHCAGSCGDGLDCIGGICTRACLTASSSCADLAPDASCTDQSVEPGAVAVCDVACTVQSDCARLGANYTCQGSFCRTGSPPDPVGETPEPGPMTPVCESFADQSPPPDVRGFTIVNRTSQVLYLQQFGSCGGDNEYSLVQVRRDGQDVNTSGGGCGLSCDETLSSGWSRSYSSPNMRQPTYTPPGCTTATMPRSSASTSAKPGGRLGGVSGGTGTSIPGGFMPGGSVPVRPPGVGLPSVVGGAPVMPGAISPGAVPGSMPPGIMPPGMAAPLSVMGPWMGSPPLPHAREARASGVSSGT